MIDDPHVREVLQTGQRVLRISEGRPVQFDAAEHVGANGGLPWNGALIRKQGANCADRPKRYAGFGAQTVVGGGIRRAVGRLRCRWQFRAGLSGGRTGRKVLGAKMLQRLHDVLHVFAMDLRQCGDLLSVIREWGELVRLLCTSFLPLPQSPEILDFIAGNRQFGPYAVHIRSAFFWAAAAVAGTVVAHGILRIVVPQSVWNG